MNQRYTRNTQNTNLVSDVVILIIYSWFHKIFYKSGMVNDLIRLKWLYSHVNIYLQRITNFVEKYTNCTKRASLSVSVEVTGSENKIKYFTKMGLLGFLPKVNNFLCCLSLHTGLIISGISFLIWNVLIILQNEDIINLKVKGIQCGTSAQNYYTQNLNTVSRLRPLWRC